MKKLSWIISIILVLIFTINVNADMKKTKEGLYYCTETEGKVDPAIVAKLKYNLISSEELTSDNYGEAIMFVFEIADTSVGYLPSDVKSLYMIASLYKNMVLEGDETPFFIIIGITEIYSNGTISFFGFNAPDRDKKKARYKRMKDESDLKL